MKYTLIILLALTACSSTCFKIDGEYKGVKGGFTYCLNESKSKELEMPILANEEKKESIILTQDEIEKLLNKIKDVVSKEVKKDKDIWKELKEHLKGK